MKKTLHKLALIHQAIQDKLDRAMYGDIKILIKDAISLHKKYWELRNAKDSSSDISD